MINTKYGTYTGNLDTIEAEARGQGHEIFAKAYPAANAAKVAFDALVDELSEMFVKGGVGAAERDVRRVVGVRKERDSSFAHEIADLAKSFPAPSATRVVAVEAVERGPSGADIVAKAFHVLRTDATLTPLQRGMLALRLSELTEAVTFAKAHPLATEINKLEKDLAEEHASTVIREARKLLERGGLSQQEHVRITQLLLHAEDALKRKAGADQR